MGWLIVGWGARTVTGAAAALDPLEDFLAVDRDGLRGVDPDANLVSLHPENRDGHVLADDNRFPNSARQNKHIEGPPQSLFLMAAWTPAIAAGQRCGTLTPCQCAGHVATSHNARTADFAATLTPNADRGAEI